MKAAMIKDNKAEAMKLDDFPSVSISGVVDELVSVKGGPEAGSWSSSVGFFSNSLPVGSWKGGVSTVAASDVRSTVGSAVVGRDVGLIVGFVVGFVVGLDVGVAVGFVVGFAVGFAVGLADGFVVGFVVGNVVGDVTGLFVNG